MNRDLKIAILEKLSNIMDEAEEPMYMNVAINYSPEEVPSIEYRIKEKIIFSQPQGCHSKIQHPE